MTDPHVAGPPETPDMDEQNELAADELTAGTDTTPTDAGTSPKPAGTETGDSTETPDDGGDAGAGDEADKPEQDDEDEPKRRRPSGSERLRRTIETLRAENEALRTSRPNGDGAAPDLSRAIETEIGPAPKESDYPGDYLAFEQAKLAYEIDKRQVTRELRREHARETARSESTQKVRTAELVETFQERLDELEAKLPGSLKAIQATTGPLNPVVRDLVLESEKSALLALHLAKNPTALASLNVMSERQAAREIGRLEARLSLPKPKTATAAPAPVKPLRGAAAPAPDPSKMSQAEYEAWRAKSGRR